MGTGVSVPSLPPAVEAINETNSTFTIPNNDSAPLGGAQLWGITMPYTAPAKPVTVALPTQVNAPTIDPNQTIYTCNDAITLSAQITAYNEYLTGLMQAQQINYNSNSQYCQNVAGNVMNEMSSFMSKYGWSVDPKIQTGSPDTWTYRNGWINDGGNPVYCGSIGYDGNCCYNANGQNKQCYACYGSTPWNTCNSGGGCLNGSGAGVCNYGTLNNNLYAGAYNDLQNFTNSWLQTCTTRVPQPNTLSLLPVMTVNCCQNINISGIENTGGSVYFDNITNSCTIVTPAPTTPPATTMPATTQPATTQPATTQPATTMPATTQPATTQPATTQPATTQPATTMPTTISTYPATTQPTTMPVISVNSPVTNSASASASNLSISAKIGIGIGTIIIIIIIILSILYSKKRKIRR